MNQDVTNTNATPEGFEGLFQDAAQRAAFGGANQLHKTNQLTHQATAIANKVFNIVSADAETFADKVKASQMSHDAMDDLINEVYQIGAEDIDYLKDEDEEVLEKMLRSQQSKRSRAKSKVMTRENYITMMVGAISENLLRLAMGKAKSAGGGAVLGDIGFSQEDLEALAGNAEELKKAIRNVQSKKSIMRGKADFDEESPRYKQLLEAEEMLKNLRGNGTRALSEEAQKALETQFKVEDLLAEKDLENLPEEEAKQLLASIREMMASK